MWQRADQGQFQRGGVAAVEVSSRLPRIVELDRRLSIVSLGNEPVGGNAVLQANALGGHVASGAVT